MALKVSTTVKTMPNVKRGRKIPAEIVGMANDVKNGKIVEASGDESKKPGTEAREKTARAEAGRVISALRQMGLTAQTTYDAEVGIVFVGNPSPLKKKEETPEETPEKAA